jgi:hypothetical protein
MFKLCLAHPRFLKCGSSRCKSWNFSALASNLYVVYTEARLCFLGPCLSAVSALKILCVTSVLAVEKPRKTRHTLSFFSAFGPSFYAIEILRKCVVVLVSTLVQPTCRTALCTFDPCFVTLCKVLHVAALIFYYRCNFVTIMAGPSARGVSRRGTVFEGTYHRSMLWCRGEARSAALGSPRFL